MIYRKRRRLPLALPLTSLACLPLPALASGFAIPEISILGLGTSNAVAANTEELGAIPYNPALSAFHPGWTLSGGIQLVSPSIKVTTQTGKHKSQGQDIVPIPMFQATYQASERITLGLGLTAPFGLETDWDADAPVFPVFAETAQQLAPLNPQFAAIAGLHPTKSKLEVVDLSPTVAFRVGPNTAVAAGADYYHLNTVEFNSAAVRNKGDGHAWGWNASLAHRTERWSVGVSFRSKAKIDIDGRSDFGAASVRASTDLTMPWRVQAGVRFEATDKLALEFDITRTGWSSFDRLEIKNSVRDIVSTNDWDDANAYRFGVTYAFRPGTQLRFGYTYDRTPQPNEYFSARIPDDDRHLFSIGIGQELGKGFMLEAGYMFVRFEERKFTGTSYLNQILSSLPTPDTEPNGTDAYQGNYKTHVHLFGLGLAKRFN